MFNNEVADWIGGTIARMDDDEAEMFSRFLVYEVHKQDIENNRRTLDRRIEEVSKRIVSAMEQISKADESNFYAKYGFEQPRNRGRFSKWQVNVSREKEGKPRKMPSGADIPRGRAGAVTIGDFDLSSALARTDKEASAFAEQWMADQRNAGTNSGTYSRIAAGAGLLQALPSPKAQAAGAVGQFVGSFGPEAEKVIGPVARRTAYRYRGTERMPDSELERIHSGTLGTMRRNAGMRSDDQVSPEMSMAAAEQAAVQYFLGKDNKDRKRIPKKALAELQRQSGKLPPSEGIIISADGEIVTQAVGYNEDHYLPFNLKNLKGLQGGAYVRTRSTGGLTTEDIYTGLISGARSVTVVSRSGVFTLDFDDDLRGGRRYSDKARQMVGQYAHLLDAIQSEKVQRKNLSPTERAEIREEVEGEAKTSSWMSRADIEDEIREREKNFIAARSFTKEEVAEVERLAQQDSAAYEDGRLSSSRTRGERVPSDPAARLRFFTSQRMDDLMEEKKSRMYKLDGEGYYTALEALREQFPYYIADVRAKRDKEINSTETDKGYVRPNYSRPKSVQAGYFDTDIEGFADKERGGKYSAASTNYQNYARGQATPGGQSVGSKKEPEETGASTEDKNITPAQKKQKDRNRVESMLRQTHSRDALVGQLKEVTGAFSIYEDDVRKNKERFPLVNKAITASKSEENAESFWLDISQNQSDLDAYTAETKALMKLMRTAPNLPEEHKRTFDNAEPFIDRYSKNMREEVPLDRKSWNLASVIPATPRTYDDSRPEHTYNQAAEVYTKAWSNVLEGSGLDKFEFSGGKKISISDTDEQLRMYQASLRNVGVQIAAIEEGNRKGVRNSIAGDKLEVALRELGYDEKSAERDRLRVESSDGSSKTGFIKSLEKLSDGINQLRSIKMHAEDKLGQASSSTAVAPVAPVAPQKNEEANKEAKKPKKMAAVNQDIASLGQFAWDDDQKEAAKTITTAGILVSQGKYDEARAEARKLPDVLEQDLTLLIDLQEQQDDRN